jgi:hypothetical protein
MMRSHALRTGILLLLLALPAVAAFAQSLPAVEIRAGGQSIASGRIYLLPEDVAVGARSGAVVFTILNRSTSGIRLSAGESVEIGGSDAAMFRVDRRPHQLIPAGGSDAFSVVFAPSAAGPYMAAITLQGAERPLFTFVLAANAVPSGE